MSDKSISEQPEFPAFSDDELRETLDLMATVVASMSDRVDAQTKVLGRVNKTATEARQRRSRPEPRPIRKPMAI